jgi:hypothetical protein
MTDGTEFLTVITIGYAVLIVVCAFIVGVIAWYLWTNK